MIGFLGLGAIFLALWLVTGMCLPPLLRGVRAIVARLARWLRGYARLAPLFGRLESWRSYFPLAIALALGTVVFVVAADAFFDLAGALKDHDPTVQRVDTTVYAWVAPRRTPTLNAFFLTLTTVGGPPVMATLVGVVLAVLLARKRFRWAAYLAATSAGGALLNQLLKFHYLRQRPDLGAAVLNAMGYSFPSGHAMCSTVVLGAFSYLAARSIRAWRKKSAVLAAFATLAFGTGVSRVYLGVHWTSDVAGGFVAGLLCLAATTTGYELFRQYRLGTAARISAADVESRS